MRKTLLLSALAAGVLGIVAVAYSASKLTLNIASVTPTKAGTLAHPKVERIRFAYSVTTTDGNRPPPSSDQLIGFGTGLKVNNRLKATATKFAFAQCKQAQATANACPASTKVGSGIVNNFAGLSSNPSQKIPCKLILTIFNGDSKVFPPAQNDGRSVREDVWLHLAGSPTTTGCPLVVNAPIPAAWVPFRGGRALSFHISKVPFQHPAAGTDNSVISQNTSLFKTARVKGKTRGYFESTACPKGGRPFVAILTDANGGRITASKKAPCSK